MGEARGKRCAGRIGLLVAACRQAANNSLQAGLLRIVKTPLVVHWPGVLGFHRDGGDLLALRICHARKTAMLVPFPTTSFLEQFPPVSPFETRISDNSCQRHYDSG